MTLLLLAILPFALDDAPAILARLERLRFGDAPASRPATLAMRGHFQFTMGAQARDEPVNGPFEILFSGSKVCESMDYGSFGKMQRGSDGTAVWSVHPVTGVALVEGNGADTLKRMLEVTRGVTWRSVYVAAESAGTEMLDGRKHHVLRMKPEKGEPDRWWLDAESGLLTRWDVIISDMEGKPAPVHVEYEDWRTAAGALRPHREKVTMGTAVGVFVYDSIEANVDIPAERFAVPDAVTKAMEKDASKLGVQLQEHEEEHVATIRTKARREEVGRTLATLLPEVMAYLTDVHAKTTGPPFA
ncbi:MAG TPA: hypothetical protein VKE69_04545, partial [Planctomycetota bacterium]|nr:hypothetical protein [Planctomycetota bacterium]